MNFITSMLKIILLYLEKSKYFRGFERSKVNLSYKIGRLLAQIYFKDYFFIWIAVCIISSLVVMLFALAS